MRYIKDNSQNNYDNILDFANMVFSMEYTGIDFSVYLPKAYGVNGDSHGNVTHHMYLDDDSDKIRALVDTYPIKLRLGDMTINADYVGTVAVHPRFRNMGLFSNLMGKVYNEALAKNTDMLIVDGQRARYGNFGYEKAGMKYSFNIDYKALLYEADDEAPYGFEEVDEDSKLLDDIYELYCKRNVTARNRDNFYRSLIGMKASVFAVIKDGNVAGYVNLSEDEGKVNEFAVIDVKQIPRLMLDLIEGFGMGKLMVTVGSDEIDKIKYLERVSDYYSVSASHQIRILNYEKVIGFLLKWKQRYYNLPDGEYTFGIKKDDSVEDYKITIKEQDVIVERTVTRSDEVFTEMEFVKVMTTGYFHVEYENKRKAPAGWFPLPFFLPEADTF